MKTSNFLSMTWLVMQKSHFRMYERSDALNNKPLTFSTEW